MIAEFDFGHRQRKITASASGILASGKPSWNAESTKFLTMTAACGLAKPISSLAMTNNLRQGEIKSLLASNFAR